MNPTLIVCAAVQYYDGEIRKATVLGARHFDRRMIATIEALQDTGRIDGNDYYRQGFIDQRGKFYTRTEAWKIAEAAGQIRYRCGGDTADGGTLYSENLY